MLEQHTERRKAHRFDDDGVKAAVEQCGALRGRSAPRGDGNEERHEGRRVALVTDRRRVRICEALGKPEAAGGLAVRKQSGRVNGIEVEIDKACVDRRLAGLAQPPFEECERLRRCLEFAVRAARRRQGAGAGRRLASSALLNLCTCITPSTRSMATSGF